MFHLLVPNAFLHEMGAIPILWHLDHSGELKLNLGKHGVFGKQMDF